MIQVTNAADTAKVLISGEIGQGWFTDGFTLEKLKNSIGSDDISNIELEINSLGGDLIEALAIYDSLKTSNAKVKAKIVGSTASAGTVIAMAADMVEITENSNFLIHRASTMAGGTVDDIEKAA
jgi:ATP-dependent protease ClpP protease subunit